MRAEFAVLGVVAAVSLALDTCRNLADQLCRCLETLFRWSETHTVSPTTAYLRKQGEYGFGTGPHAI